MLHIKITSEISNEFVHDIDAYFDSTYDPDWIDNDFSKALIEAVDKSHVVAPRIIDSPYLGYVDPTHLSGGVKCVLCLMFDSNRNFDITVCGDNCAEWIQSVAVNKDITVKLDYLMKFVDKKPFDIHVMNNDSYPCSAKEFADIYCEVR